MLRSLHSPEAVYELLVQEPACVVAPGQGWHRPAGMRGNRVWAFLDKRTIKPTAVHNELILIQVRCTSCFFSLFSFWSTFIFAIHYSVPICLPVTNQFYVRPKRFVTNRSNLTEKVVLSSRSMSVTKKCFYVPHSNNGLNKEIFCLNWETREVKLCPWRAVTNLRWAILAGAQGGISSGRREHLSPPPPLKKNKNKNALFHIACPAFVTVSYHLLAKLTWSQCMQGAGALC